MSGRISATIAILWVAVVAGITLWFVRHPIPTYGPVDPDWRLRFQDGGTEFDVTAWFPWCAIATAITVVLLVITYVWSGKRVES